jgi:hypothetical protein
MAKKTSDTAALRGFFRVQITGDNKVVGDSGWRENTVTNMGKQNYLLTWLVTGSGGKFVQYMALGTGGTAATSDTSLSGELYDKSTNATTNSRAAVSTSINSSTQAQFTAAFNSANSFATASHNISNVGLFDSYLTSLANVGTMFAGNTFASSSVATNQSVQVTYQINLS